MRSVHFVGEIYRNASEHDPRRCKERSEDSKPVVNLELPKGGGSFFLVS